MPKPKQPRNGPGENRDPTLAPDPLAETTAMPAAVDPRAARMRGRSWVAALVAVALLGAIGGWAASRTIESPRDAAAHSQPPTATIITATVVSTTLQNTVIGRGQIGATDSVQVGYGQLIPPSDSNNGTAGSGTSLTGGGGGAGNDVLTAVFAKRGDRVHQGQAVVEVDGRPVIVLQGDTAAYRDIKPGVAGVDVEELQRALTSMSYYTGPTTGVLDAATKGAVTRMYRAAGYAPATTDGGDGSDQTAIDNDNNALSDATSSLNDTNQQRDTANATYSAALQAWDQAQKSKPSTAGPKPTYQGPTDGDIAKAQRAVTAAQQALNLDVARRGVMVPRNEIVFVPRLPATLTQIGTGVGYAPGSPLFTLTPDALSLSTQVDTSQAAFLKVGSTARIDLPTGSVLGRVTSIRPSTTAGQTAIGISTPVNLPLTLEGSDVKVTFVAASTAGRVLAVPQGAINSDAGGALSVIVESPGGGLTRVPVTTGVSTSDLVQITPATAGTLHAGDVVVIGG